MTDYKEILNDTIAYINKQPTIHGAQPIVLFLEADRETKTLTLWCGTSNHDANVLLKERIMSNHPFEDLYGIFVHKLISEGMFSFYRLVRSLHETKFKLGDKVRVICYGGLMWQNKHHEPEPITSYPLLSEDENIRVYDTDPGLIGKEGIISKAQKSQGKDQYSIDGIPGKIAWYDNGQLELIKANPNVPR